LYTLLAFTKNLVFFMFTSVLSCYDFGDLRSKRAAVQRQADMDGGSFVKAGFSVNGTIVVKDGTSGDVGSQTTAPAIVVLLCREKRLSHVFEGCGGHSSTSIGNLDMSASR